MRRGHYEQKINYTWPYPTLETHGVPLDMSFRLLAKSYQGLIFKLKSVGVSDSLLNLIEHLLSNRF